MVATMSGKSGKIKKNKKYDKSQEKRRVFEKKS